MGTEKNKYGISYHLSLTYHVIARMRNAHFTYKYDDFGTPQYLWNG